MSSCFPELMIFCFFQSFPLPFPLLKFFFFYGISMVLLLDFYGIPMGFP